MPTKTKNNVRLPNGNFASKKDVNPAVFQSNFPNYQVVMDSYIAERNNKHMGKRLDFSPNGTYETKDQAEILFLEEVCRTCGPITKVKKTKDVTLKESAKKKG